MENINGTPIQYPKRENAQGTMRQASRKSLSPNAIPTARKKYDELRRLFPNFMSLAILKVWRDRLAGTSSPRPRKSSSLSFITWRQTNFCCSSIVSAQAGTASFTAISRLLSLYVDCVISSKNVQGVSSNIDKRCVNAHGRRQSEKPWHTRNICWEKKIYRIRKIVYKCGTVKYKYEIIISKET